MSKLILLIVIISVSAACGFFIGQQAKSSANSEIPILEETKKPNFLKILKDEKIISFQSLEDDGNGKKLFGVVQQLNEPCEKDYDLNSCQKFSVYDESGKSLFEYKDFVIESFREEYLTRQNSQIIIESNGGGTDNSLKIIDFKNGKFAEIINSNETQMRGGFWTTPEYRSGMKTPYFTPSQIFVIGQIGGADENPSAAVFRFKAGKYQKAGEIKMQELGDFIEKQIAKNQ